MSSTKWKFEDILPPVSPVIQDLRQLTTINGVPVQVSAQQDYKKGIISHPEIALLSDEELQ